MGVYLGNSGWVEITRTSVQTALSAAVNAADINVQQSRVGLDTGATSLITGDRASIRSLDNTPLEFVASWSYASIEAYLNVDEMGGTRLYRTYADAINDNIPAAIPLQDMANDQRVDITVMNPLPHLLGQITSYELNTSREAVDITCLSQDFRAQYSAGLISGQGRLNCSWEYRDHACDGTEAGVEWPHYFSNLIVRTDLGSSFFGAFVLKGEGGAVLGTSGSAAAAAESLVYEAECVVTNVALTIDPTQIIRSVIEFATTGPINMRLRTPPEGGYLLREEADERISLELREGNLRP